MKSSKKQINKEINERERLIEETVDLRKLADDYAKLKQEKRERMKVLQQEQIKATTKIKEKMEQKNKLERAREANLQEIKRLDTRIDRMTVDHGHAQKKLNTLMADNPWVCTEKEMFNNPESTEYSKLASTKFD